MAQHDLYLDTDRSEAVMGPSDSTLAALPPFVQGDTLALRIWLLKGFSRLSPYTKVPVSGITIQAALGTRTGSLTTYYTQQFTWVPSVDLGQPYFAADFPMNTEEITDLLGDEASATAWFEVKQIEGGTPKTVLSKLVTVQASVIKEDGLVVPVPQTPLSAEVANAMYVKVVHTGSFDLINPTTLRGCRVYFGDDDVFHADPITPLP